MSAFGWKDWFIDEDGNEKSIADIKRTVNFAWVQRTLGISRKTLQRARRDGRLPVYPGRPSFTRTDWIHHFIINNRPTYY